MFFLIVLLRPRKQFLNEEVDDLINQDNSTLTKETLNDAIWKQDLIDNEVALLNGVKDVDIPTPEEADEIIEETANQKFQIQKLK